MRTLQTEPGAQSGYCAHQPIFPLYTPPFRARTLFPPFNPPLFLYQYVLSLHVPPFPPIPPHPTCFNTYLDGSTTWGFMAQRLGRTSTKYEAYDAAGQRKVRPACRQRL